MGFRDDVRELIYTFNVFLLPSLFEGLPNAILEAMAASRPIVATAVDGVPEVISNGKTGFLIASENPDKISDNVIKLLGMKDQGEYMGKLARKYIEENHTFNLQFAEFENLYKKVFELSEQ